MGNTQLLVIDPQVDFCDPEGALFVTGAQEDMQRLSEFISRNADKLEAIHCTLDNHHVMDIAHPLWWQDSDGNPPDPFTIIDPDAVESGAWSTAQTDARGRSLNYVKTLGQNGRYPLCIWPPHCLIGSSGAAVLPELFAAFTDWEASGRKTVNYIRKGSNPWTEHYSAIQADVPDPEDPGTLLNASLIHALEEADQVFIAGEAGSHCVANTVRDLAENFRDSDSIKKLVLLEDTTSPVPGFESFQEEFLEDLSARGMQLTLTVDANLSSSAR
ncbi:MAG: hypothetical protein QGF00_02525 [Planctomycetota bacterium]|jgi:nicotinamidase-related amidase|nr:hypothetical protein [Planctomycetota bacterium]MDP7248450.1 hypothetical protein [Planctomycetota bacterium]